MNNTMNNTHTPGPWRVSPSGILVCTADDDRPHVNIAIIEDNGNDALAPMPNEVAANARLIAAAPELLAILEDTRDWLETNLRRGRINAGTANRDGDLVSQINAAIAKATATHQTTLDH